MIEFWSPTCSHCATLDPTIERLVREWGERVKIVQVDVSENPGAIKKWTVMSTPTVLLVHEGNEVARLVGVQSYREDNRELERFTSVGN